MSNVPRQIAELKTLMKENKGEGVFEFLGPKCPDATEANPTRLKIKRTAPVPLTAVVTMPVGYPADAPPIFKIEGSMDDETREAIEDLLATQASYMPGMECISTVLQSLDDLDLSTIDRGTPGRCRTIFKIDVVNNSPNFAKSLKAATEGLSCIWFYRLIECQKNAKFSFAVDPFRAVNVIVDAPDKKTAGDFVKALRTDKSFDLDMLGKPCALQFNMVEEFEMAPRAQGVPEGFSSAEYKTDEDFDQLMKPLLAAVAAKK